MRLALSSLQIKEHIELIQQEDYFVRYHIGLFGIFTYKKHDTLAIHKEIMGTPHQIFAALEIIDSKRRTNKSKNSLFDFFLFAIYPQITLRLRFLKYKQ